MTSRRTKLFSNTLLRYIFPFIAVTGVFALRQWLVPLTGTGAPFVLFFAAVLLISFLAGIGPGICTVVLSMPLAAYMFVVRAAPGGYSLVQATFQAALFGVDGFVVVYLTFLTKRARRSLQDSNRQLFNANEEITRSEARTREVIDLAPDAFFLANADGRFVDVNRAASQMLGYEREELVGKKFASLLCPEDAARLSTVVPGQGHRAEWKLRRKTNDFLAVEVSANFLPDGRWQAFIRDISERKRIEEERQVSEERFRLTIDEAPIGMALVALDGRFVRVNRALCEIVGYGPDELTARTFKDITHPDDLDVDLELAGQLARGEIPRYHLGKRYIRKDGSVVDIQLTRAILRKPDHAPLYYISQIEDITDRKRAEEALRASEAKLSGIISIAADAIISVDVNQRITIFNEGAEKIFGYSKTEMIGASLDILIPERFRTIHRQHVERFDASHDTARRMAERQDIWGLRKNGEEFPAEASISKVVVGGATLLSVVLRDITDRKRVEQALRQAVAGRDQVLGIVAHDLKNPLATIVMQSRALERRGPEPERRNPKPRQVIQRAADRMSHLIQDLLDVTRMEAGQLLVTRQPLSAEKLVTEAVEMQKPLASSSGLELQVDLGHHVPDVYGDHDRLLQVFENLIGNSIKFTKAGGRITVGATPRGHEALFWVADTGCGIPPESLPHVFDRFWQAASTHRTGAGLGLPITKGIIEAHGGHIWVESTTGRGSTFFISIPASRAAEIEKTD